MGFISALSRQGLVNQQGQGKHIAAEPGFGGDRFHRTVRSRRLQLGFVRAEPHAGRLPRFSRQTESQHLDRALMGDENRVGVEVLMRQSMLPPGVIQRASDGMQPFQDGFPRQQPPRTLFARPLRQTMALLVAEIFHLGEGPAIGATAPAIHAGNVWMRELGGRFHPSFELGQIGAQTDKIRS